MFMTTVLPAMSVSYLISKIRTFGTLTFEMSAQTEEFSGNNQDLVVTSFNSSK